MWFLVGFMFCIGGAVGVVLDRVLGRVLFCIGGGVGVVLGRVLDRVLVLYF